MTRSQRITPMTQTRNKIQQAIQQYIEGMEHFQNASGILSSGPASYHIKVLAGYIDALFNRYAPFHEGDRVRLTAAPNIKPDSHWWGSRHFLIAGAVGTADKVDYLDGSFLADVVFDDESWKDSNGEFHPPMNRHTYRIREDILEKLP